MSEEIVRSEVRDEVALVHFDDGKANAFSEASIAALNAAFDRAEKEARTVVLVGRPGRFSGGFDLSVMRGGDGAALRSLVRAGADLVLRLYDFPQPVVIACTGHAVAMGAVLLLGADLRLGAAGAFKIGLNEVAIRMTLPEFAIGLARDRLSPRHLQRATGLAELYPPEGAVEAGFLDRVVAADALLDSALESARALAALDPKAHRATKRGLRADTLERLRQSLTGL